MVRELAGGPAFDKATGLESGSRSFILLRFHLPLVLARTRAQGE